METIFELSIASRNPLKSGQGFNLEIPFLNASTISCRNPLKSGQGFNISSQLANNFSILQVVIPLNRVKVSTKTIKETKFEASAES